MLPIYRDLGNEAFEMIRGSSLDRVGESPDAALALRVGLCYTFFLENAGLKTELACYTDEG